MIGHLIEGRRETAWMPADLSKGHSGHFMESVQNVSDTFIMGQLRWQSACAWYEGCWFNLEVQETARQTLLKQEAKVQNSSGGCFWRYLINYF